MNPDISITYMWIPAISVNGVTSRIFIPLDYSIAKRSPGLIIRLTTSTTSIMSTCNLSFNWFCENVGFTKLIILLSYDRQFQWRQFKLFLRSEASKWLIVLHTVAHSVTGTTFFYLLVFTLNVVFYLFFYKIIGK
mgnify:CR=1 FL=1